MKRSSYSLPPTQSIFDFLSLILIYRFLSFQSSIEYVDDASDYKRLMMITSVLPKRNEGEKQKVETMQSRWLLNLGYYSLSTCTNTLDTWI